MKKLLSVFLAVVMCMTAIFTVTSVSAYDTKATDSDSNVIVKFSGSTLLIEGYGDMPNYEHSPWEKIRFDIQKIVVGKDITSIGVGNFSGMANLTNVKFESGSKLKKISDGAFYNDGKLPTIVLPSTVQTIGNDVFRGCKNLKNFSLSSKVTVGNNAFYYCSNLVSVSMPNAISFGEYAFGECENLKTADLGGASIGKKCFSGCNKLEKVTSGSVGEYAISGKNIKYLNLSKAKVLGKSALQNLKIKTLTIGAEKIDKEAIWNCEFETLNLKNAKTLVDDSSISYTKIKTLNAPKLLVVPYQGFSYNFIEKINFGSVTKIGYRGLSFFYKGDYALKEVTGLSKLKEIDNEAFKNCKYLKKISPTKSLQKIGCWAFEGCTSLVSGIDVSKTKKIDIGAFTDCVNLSSRLNFKIIKKIESDAFKNCPKVKCNSLGDRIEYIGLKAFLGCKSINYIYIPRSGPSLDRCTFVKNIDKIKMVNGVRKYFYNEKGKTIGICSEEGSTQLYCAKKYKMPYKVAVESISVSKSRITVKKGKNTKIKVTMNPTKCSTKSYSVKVSNNKIAKMNTKGVIKGLKKGKCKITLSSKDGSLKTKTINVTVK